MVTIKYDGSEVLDNDVIEWLNSWGIPDLIQFLREQGWDNDTYDIDTELKNDVIIIKEIDNVD